MVRLLDRIVKGDIAGKITLELRPEGDERGAMWTSGRSVFQAEGIASAKVLRPGTLETWCGSWFGHSAAMKP